MFFSSLLYVDYKTTGGRLWNSSGSLKPLSKTQQRSRKTHVEITLKNISVIKNAASLQPPANAETRLYKPLNHWRLLLMRKRMEQSKSLLGMAGEASSKDLQLRLRALATKLQLEKTGK
jgi:hypothetical protein